MEHGNMKLQIKTDFLIVPDTDFKLHQKSLYSAKWRRTDAELWNNYPYQSLDNDIQNYYMIELALYLSLMCTLFIGNYLFNSEMTKNPSDTKRKDFTEQVIHHIATISLISKAMILLTKLTTSLLI